MMPCTVWTWVLFITRQLCGLWFDSRNSKPAFYIGRPQTVARIYHLLNAIKVPTNITRLPRKLKDRSFWKASEFRNFLLYYAPYILKDILPVRFYKHFLLLSESVYCLNSNSINQDELFGCGLKLDHFLKDFERLYGSENVI